MIEEQSIKKAKELYVRMFSVAICDLFEDLLDDHDITIPSGDREGENGEARIYGNVYYDLEAKVTEVLTKLCEEVKAAPDIAISIEDYNGFPDVDVVLEETSEATFEKHILSQLTEKGFDVSQIELEIINFIDTDHKDCSWYGGAVAEVKYKDHLFSLEARGDIICTLFDKNDNELGHVKDRNNGGSFSYEMAHCLANDTELRKAKEDGLLIYENNNWFEIFVRTPDKEWQGKTWLSESDDIEECVFEMIETMDEMIEELTEREQSKSSKYAPWREYSLSKDECDNFVETMVANIRGMGIDEGSGYFGLKSFELDKEHFNLYCEISKEQEDGNIRYVVYHALEFDEGDNIWADWAYTETLDIDELKTIVFEIANADYTKDVQKHVENLQRKETNNTKSLNDVLTNAVQDCEKVNKEKTKAGYEYEK